MEVGYQESEPEEEFTVALAEIPRRCEVKSKTRKKLGLVVLLLPVLAVLSFMLRDIGQANSALVLGVILFPSTCLVLGAWLIDGGSR
jgi:hypothetical protein